jgi:signal transduction histidine kinase
LFHVSGGRVESFGRKEGLPSDSCVPVYRDSSGALWLVTEKSLTRRRNGRFQTIGQKDGLPNDVFLDLIEDDLGNFWISGKRGIHRVARHELEDFFSGTLTSVQSVTLGGRDGLLTPECSSLHHPTMAKTPDGHIWVATRNGLATFDPRRVRLNTQPLPSIIEQLVVNRREFPLPMTTAPGLAQNRRQRQPALQLPPGSGQQLEFRFTAVSLLGADRLRFRHRLEGYDGAWSPETDLRHAFFTNLRPGPYRFEVKASNAHGVWNDQPTSLSFVILPFFWQTAAFKVAVLAGSLGLAALLHWRRLQRSRWQAELRHAEAFAAEKARIAADMHDELGAALTQISILGEVAKSQASADAPARSTLARISDAAREATARMSDLVWATNPRNDSLDNLVACLRATAASQLESAAVQSDLNFPAAVEDRKVSATFRRNLLLVLKEGLSNALKHAQASRVHVEVQVADGIFHLRIADNGRGLQRPSPADYNHGNGLGNMERRVRELGGSFELRSQPGAGVRIECRVPVP